jgi:hypothetical protein
LGIRFQGAGVERFGFIKLYGLGFKVAHRVGFGIWGLVVRGLGTGVQGVWLRVGETRRETVVERICRV